MHMNFQEGHLKKQNRKTTPSIYLLISCATITEYELVMHFVSLYIRDFIFILNNRHVCLKIN